MQEIKNGNKNATEEFFKKSIGTKIRSARHKKNYTQEALAEKTSLSARYISQLERGISFGSVTTIVTLCKALNISTDYLFFDLINQDNSNLINIVDNIFLENYSKLNNYNKKVVDRLTNELIELQIDEQNGHN